MSHCENPHQWGFFCMYGIDILLVTMELYFI